MPARMCACMHAGRGSPEIDLFEVGVWQAGKPALSTSLQMAPLLPPETHWLDIANGTYLPTADDPDLLSHPNSWAGVNSYPGHPRPGSDLQDAISAIHSLNASHFESFHTYGVDWLPGAGGYVRWYLDGRLIFEINDAALQGQANSRTQSVGDRVIPREPSYLNINIAMADTFAPIDPNLPLPARMEVRAAGGQRRPRGWGGGGRACNPAPPMGVRQPLWVYGNHGSRVLTRGCR